MPSGSDAIAQQGASALPTSGPIPVGPSASIVRVRRRRRPSGEAPPLPKQLNTSGRFWVGLALGAGVFLTVVGLTGTPARIMDLVDHAVLEAIATVRTTVLTTLFNAVNDALRPLVVIGWWVAIISQLIWRRWRQLFVLLLAMLLVDNVTRIVLAVLQHPRPFGIEILGRWSDYAMPSRPLAIFAATLIVVCYTMLPAGHYRDLAKWVTAGVLAVAALARLYLAVDAPSDVIVGIIAGVSIPLVCFRLLAPNDVFPVQYSRGRTAHVDLGGRRHDALVSALHDQLGIVVEEIKPFGLEGSGGSTPMRVKVKGDPDTYVFCKLYTATHLRSDRWYKMGRTLMYGRLEDEKAFNTVRRLVQYEDYVLRLMHTARLPVPEPLGIVEITPEREYLLVMGFFDGAVEIGDAEVDQGMIDQGLAIVRRLWEAGLAHRDIKPANLLVRDGRVLVIDSAFAEVRPSPWRQAVDLANMMLVLALRSEPRTVLDRARLQFSDDEIAEAFAATRGLTMPTQLRRMMRQQGRDLHKEFLTLLPARLPPIRIQRWSLRRIGLLVAIIVGAVFAAIIAVSLVRTPLW